MAYGDSTAASLAAVRKAIGEVMVAGQTYSYMGRLMTRANLQELRAIEKDLLLVESREQDGMCLLTQVDRPT